MVGGGGVGPALQGRISPAMTVVSEDYELRRGKSGDWEIGE